MQNSSTIRRDVLSRTTQRTLPKWHPRRIPTCRPPDLDPAGDIYFFAMCHAPDRYSVGLAALACLDSRLSPAVLQHAQTSERHLPPECTARGHLKRQQRKNENTNPNANRHLAGPFAAQRPGTRPSRIPASPAVLQRAVN